MTRASGRAPQLPDRLEITDEALAARAERRVERLVRQLELRIAELDEVRPRLDRAEAELAAARLALEGCQAELRTARAKADEHDRLLATKTMRLLRVPRAAYGRVREEAARRRR